MSTLPFFSNGELSSDGELSSNGGPSSGGGLSSNGAGDRSRVVIIGAGFGGLEAAQTLSGTPVEVVLIDRNNYHKFQPLLYQVATAGLTPSDITMPVRDLLRGQANAHFRRARVTEVDPEAKRIHAENGSSLAYDYLVLSVGAVTNYLGVKGVKKHAFPLKDIPDAVHLRNEVLERFEQADARPELRVPEVLDIAVVGGGPTGVETAAMMTELVDETMHRDFDWAGEGTAQVHLVEAGSELMTSYPPSLREYTRRSLKQRGVAVHTGTRIQKVTGDGVQAGGGFLRAGTTVWAAGVRAHPLAEKIAGALGIELSPGGRLPATENLNTAVDPSVFAVGDAAGARNGEGELYPQLAPVAIQQGAHVAPQIRRHLQDRALVPFQYQDLGKMATIGRNSGIADLAGGIQLKGAFAWLIWAIVHVVKLPGLRNRIIGFMNWVYNYFTYDRKARMILDTIPLNRETRPSVRRIRDKLHDLK